MTCRECIYVEACYALNKEIKQHPNDFLETDLCAKQCKTFKARADFLDANGVFSILHKLIARAKPISSTFYKVFSKLETYISEKCIIPSASDADLGRN